jgi:hypothetical protein
MSGRPIRKSAGERTNSAQAAATSMLLPLIECHVLHAVSAHALSEQELAQHLVDRGYKIRHPELRELFGWPKHKRLG